MRKAVAFICFITFFALQYGKLVSYWNCKITAAVLTAICDCEKKIIDIHSSDTAHSNNTSIIKHSTEETYVFHEVSYSPAQLLPVIINSNIPVYVAIIPQNDADAIFQPPRA